MSSRALFTQLSPIQILKVSRRKHREVALKHSAQDVLQNLLVSKQLRSFRFENNYKIHDVVVDFYSENAKLAVEVELAGEEHTIRNKEEDLRRTALERFGVKLLRFPEEVVLQRPESVRNTILEEMPLKDLS